MQSIAAFGNQQQTPHHLKESGLFRIHPDDDPIRVAITDFDLKNKSYIAKGSFGKVYKTSFRGGLDVAEKKCIFKERRVEDYEHEQHISLESWYRELSFHGSSKHEHIVRLHGFIAISADISTVPLPDGKLRPPDPNRPKALHLFLELMTCSFREILDCLITKNSKTPFKCPEGTLQVGPFRAFLKHVCSGLIYLHDNGYMHRDLKPGNILLKVEEGRAVAKLADFGTIKDYKETTRGEEKNLHSADPGTIKYGAPEVIYNEGPYTKSCDLWSISITSVQLISGYHPVVTDESQNSTSRSSNTIYCRRISSDDPFTDLPEKVGLGGELGEILGKCLEREPKKRPSAGDVLEVVGGLENDGVLLWEWFKDLGIGEDIESKRTGKR